MVIAMTVLVVLTALSVVICGFLGQKEIWDLDKGKGRLSRLKRRRDRLLRTLKDLDFEKEAGTLSQEEYDRLRKEYKAEAVRAAKDLDRARQGRLRQVVRAGGSLSQKARKRVESLIAERQKAATLWLFAAGILAAAVTPVQIEAATQLKARVFDAESSYPEVRHLLSQQEFNRAFSPESWSPYSGKPLTVELVDLQEDSAQRGQVLKSWQVSTDANGEFTLDIERSVPKGAAFVASGADSVGKLYSSFFTAISGSTENVVLYRTTNRPEGLIVQTKVTYDYVALPGTQPKIRVQVVVGIVNNDSTMYIGGGGTSGERSILKIPFPRGATIVKNEGPDPGGWVVSADRSALVMNAPVQGILGSLATWKVVYDVLATQTFVQSYSYPFPQVARSFSASCIHEDMALETRQLMPIGPGPHEDPPVSAHAKRSYDNFGLQVDLGADEPVQMVLTVDNAAIGQVSTHSVKWVGGFLLIFLLAIFTGLTFGKRGTAAELLYADLSGEEVLDRIVELDQQFKNGKIKEVDYRPNREALVNLAAEELSDPGLTTKTDARSAAPVVALSSEARDLIRRIDEIDSTGQADASVIAERAHLLEALAKALPREAKRK